MALDVSLCTSVSCEVTSTDDQNSFIYDYPTTASFLTEEEKALAYPRVKYQACKNTGRRYAKRDTFEWKYVIQSLIGMEISI